MSTIAVGVIAFSAIVMLLVGLLLLAKRWLVAADRVHLQVNGDTGRSLAANRGSTLLDALASGGIFLPSACGGRGICGACKLQVSRGGGAPLPTETSLLAPGELKQQWRLACQVKVKEDMALDIPAAYLGARQWQCRVRSSRSVATLIKELVLDLPQGESMSFRSGAYVLVDCPPHQLAYTDFDIAPAFHDRWNQLQLWHHHSRVMTANQRAYSLANHPGEEGIIMLNVRLEPPPADQPTAPPGAVSSYLFGLKPGDTLAVTGPFGEFYAKEGDAEMIFIGGGAGMAPMRSHILDQLEGRHSTRKISFWYGARDLREAFYRDRFEQLARDHDNFSWTLALSAPMPDDNWSGPVGFIHQVVLDHYLSAHPSPEDAEYYLCGPPLMIDACVFMLCDLGVEAENIRYDKFG